MSTAGQPIECLAAVAWAPKEKLDVCKVVVGKFSRVARLVALFIPMRLSVPHDACRFAHDACRFPASHPPTP